MRNRITKFVVLALCAAALLGSTCSAALYRRPFVGFLPFQGPRGAFTYAIPQLVYWEMGCIPGMQMSPVYGMIDCVQLDRLDIPENLSDTTAYSRLADATGVDYLVTGDVERQDKSSVRFRVVVYSAADPLFHGEQVYECALPALVDEAVRAANYVAAAVKVPVGSSIKFDIQKIDPKALRSIDRSMRIEADSAGAVRARRLADEAKVKCPESSFVADWAHSYSDYSAAELDDYAKLIGRCPDNALILQVLIYGHSDYTGSARVKTYASKWLKLDPTSPLAQIAASGRCADVETGSWRTQLSIADMYGAVHDIEQSRKWLKMVESRYPRSAYIRYFGWRMLGWAQECASARAEIEQAVRLNPDSCKLQLCLVRGYMSVGETEAALTAVRKILKRWPKRSDCHALAAWVYRERNEYSKAAAEYRIAERLDPDASVDHKFLATQDLRSGNLIQALRGFANGDPDARRGTILFSVALTGVFLLAILAAAVLIRFLLRPRAESKG